MGRALYLLECSDGWCDMSHVCVALVYHAGLFFFPKDDGLVFMSVSVVLFGCADELVLRVLIPVSQRCDVVTCTFWHSAVLPETRAKWCAASSCVCTI